MTPPVHASRALRLLFWIGLAILAPTAIAAFAGGSGRRAPSPRREHRRPVAPATTSSPVAAPPPVETVQPRRSRRITVRRAASIAASALALTAFLAWMLAFRPPFLGGSTTPILITGISMEPTLHEGDLVVVRKRDTYRPGQVVTYRVPDGEPGAGALVIHRVLDRAPRGGFVVQGDNVPAPDMWRPTEEDIVGAEVAAIPGGGRVLMLLHAPLALAFLAAALSIWLALSWNRKESSGR